MTYLSHLLLTVGLLSLFHAAYSAHEHSHYLSLRSPSSSSQSVPLDIQIETLVSVLVVCLGLILHSEPLKPINWAQWAGTIEEKGGASNPFKGLEERVGFMDIRGKRKLFAEWVREGSVSDVQIGEDVNTVKSTGVEI